MAAVRGRTLTNFGAFLSVYGLSGGSTPDSFAQWGVIEQFIDPDEYTVDVVFLLQVGMFTASAGQPITCRLYNITDDNPVTGSMVSSTATSYEIVRSNTFDLLPGLKKYRLEFGGVIGGTYSFHGGDVKAKAS